jgi:cytochrome c oxidase cbb3-type subunit I/II
MNQLKPQHARKRMLHTQGEHWHRWIERRPVQLLVAATIAILIGGMVEVFPMIMIDENVPKIESVRTIYAT